MDLTKGSGCAVPVSDIDPYSDSALVEPWELYKQLRECGAAVWLSRYGVFALTRYDSVMKALADATTFSSASGVMMNDEANRMLSGITLCSDGDEHRRLRRIIARPLSANKLAQLKLEISNKATELVDRLLARGEFCAVTELATALPVDIVASAVGLSEDGRERMLEWAEQLFNCIGPSNDRCLQGFPALGEMMNYATAQAVRGKLKPGGWAEGIIDAVDRGEVDEASRPGLMIDYMAPSLHTTIQAIANGVWLFAKNPDEWHKVREQPAYIASALNEVLRMEAPIQGFSRVLTCDYDMEGIVLTAGSRAIAFYGAGNRDPRKFPNPDVFDVMRGASDQLAFGWGPHVCVGQHLARLEMTAIFGALTKRVREFKIKREVRAINNVLRGFSKLIVSVA